MGKQLRRLQGELGCKNESQLAEMLCITQGTLSKMLNNKAKVPETLAIFISKTHKKTFAVDWLHEKSKQILTEIM